ncbi:MAG: phosphate acyltransferase PlsX [Candidatus Omnitrophica bacterium]|nr:phosphate acyltransferase PlsX [Candidatus Omnitrophota bacterium]MCM8833408.1 phosphate acyltransferase PlsX [Candidatus Omnitrophota bacterium]
MRQIKLALDAMGGDNAPLSPVKSCEFIKEKGLKIYLVGDQEKIKKILKKKNEIFEIVDCPNFVEMDEKVSSSLLKRNTSMKLVLQMQKEKKVDISLSAGNTAAFVSLAISELGMIEGIERPSIAVLFPNITGGVTIFIDAGANVNPKPYHLLQSGILGFFYAKIVFDIKNPKVALLNVGEEETKGDDLRKHTYKILKENSTINFIGNIEGHEIFTGKADVIITDGFTGNIVLKSSEGITRSFRTILIKELMKDFLGKIGTFLIRKNLREFAKKADYAEYGGGVLLGVNGNVIISHGRSSPRAIYNAIKLGEKIVMSNFYEKIKELKWESQ